MPNPPPPARAGRPSLPKTLAAYAAVAIVGVCFFFALHHVGNRIPFDLAKQKLAAALHSAHANESYFHGISNPFGFCQLSLVVLGGASAQGAGAASSSAFLDAVRLRMATAPRRAHGSSRPCDALSQVLAGVEMRIATIKSRYWWGGKALYAMALRHVSVAELRELTETSIYVAYAALALALLALSPKAFFVASPLIAFGALFSGVRHFADVENGMPHLWTVASAAMLTSLMLARRLTPRAGSAEIWASGMRLFCFAVGMVSSYLWLGDGHAFLAICWIGLIVYFGSERTALSGDSPEVSGSAGKRVRSAVACSATYLIGFSSSYALGIAVKTVVIGGQVWEHLLREVAATIELSVQGHDTMGARELLERYYVLVADALNVHLAAGQVVPLLLIALAAAALFACLRARSRQLDLARDLSVAIGLMLAQVPQFLIEEDVPFRTARYLFVMHALPLSCLMLALLAMTTRARLVVIGALSGCAWLAYAVQSHYREREAAQIATGRPAVRSAFDVHLREDAVHFVREPCSATDVEPWFLLHVFPSDPAVLPPRRRPHGFIALDFPFAWRGRFTDGAKGEGRSGGEGAQRCMTRALLPDYPLDLIRAGQFRRDELSWLSQKREPLWTASFPTDQKGLAARAEDALRAAAARSPAARSWFDVHVLHDGWLAYVRAPCRRGHAKERFFLHVTPKSPSDLPADAEVGFENLDFDFWEHGGAFDDACVAAVRLPQYPMARIRTGQWIRGVGQVWQVEIAGAALESG